jgi:hypothetical protein
VDDSDLPDPVRPVLKEEEHRDRKDKLFGVLFNVACFYSLVHKLIIPSILNFTTVSHPEYKEIDLWFLPVAFIWFVFWKDQKPNSLKGLFAGILVAHAAHATFQISSGEIKGWLIFSQTLSNLPIAALLIVWLTRHAMQTLLIYAWGAGIVYIGVHGFLTSRTEPSVFEKAAPAESSFRPHDSSSSFEEGKTIWKQCGAAQLDIDKTVSQALPEMDLVELRDCGFYPAAFRKGTGPLTLSNVSSMRANLHIFIRTPQGEKRHSNRVIAPRERVVLQELSMPAGSVGYIYSDAHPQHGGVAMLSGVLSEGSLSVSRLPLKIDWRP